VLDALDRPGEAFTAYGESNAVFRSEYAARFDVAGQASIGDTLNWLVPWAKSLAAGSWTAPPSARPSRGGEREHVFLMGFPRSGTTLAESVLAAHPDIVALEERNPLQMAVKAFLGDASALSRLGSLTDRELQPYRDDYWSLVKSYGVDPNDKIFIDKNPFNTLKLPLITRLFPRAKVIFAVRDPRDVVLSCFRRRFNMNASTYELLDLKRTAIFYAGTMQFAETFRNRAAFAEHRLVFERLIERFAAETQALCAFIGADWRPDLLDFAGRAQRGGVASASSAQIARGLNAEGVGQWRRYRAELAPVLGALSPWVDKYGYQAD
jgi:hypothetical protein